MSDSTPMMGHLPTLTGHYVSDPHHTFVYFAVKHFGTSTVFGRFDGVQATVDLDDAELERGQAEVKIDMHAINSGIAAFDEHLRSDAFFNADKYPQAVFRSRKLFWEEARLLRVEGDLTLLGQTHPVLLRTANFNCYNSSIHKAQVVGGDFEAIIRRSQWGMSWGIDFGIPDEVHLKIQIEVVRQQEQA